MGQVEVAWSSFAGLEAGPLGEVRRVALPPIRRSSVAPTPSPSLGPHPDPGPAPGPEVLRKVGEKIDSDDLESKNASRN